MQSIYLLDAEDAVMIWKGEEISLGYKYDVSIILEDILHMLDTLTGAESGQQRIAWPSNSFRCDWTMKWHIVC